MRILHLVAPAPVGGLETVVRSLARAQRDRGHDVGVVLTVSDPQHPFIGTLRGEALPVHVVVAGDREYGRERALVRDIIARVSPQVVHSHGYRPDLIHPSDPRLLQAARVSTLHGFTGRSWKIRLYERMQLRRLRRASAVIAVSRGVAARAAGAGIASERVHLVRNAYESHLEPLSREAARGALGIPDGQLAIGWVGRLSVEKGPDVAVKALAGMRDVRPHLHLIGDGPSRTALAAQAAELGIAHRVHFGGTVPNAGALLRAFDAILLSSRTEGTPMVILEAMAAGVPIVATAVGGVPDVVSEASAWLAPPEEAGALAAALATALTNATLARQRAAQATAVLRQQFTIDEWLDRHDDIYCSIVH